MCRAAEDMHDVRAHPLPGGGRLTQDGKDAVGEFDTSGWMRTMGSPAPRTAAAPASTAARSIPITARAAAPARSAAGPPASCRCRYPCS
jgi:hypothetical protein